MRAAAEVFLADQPRFHSIDGSAQTTNLPDQGVDVIAAAQAFHWFDPERTRSEFDRILRPDGHVVLIWNERRLNSTPFLRDYEALLIRFGTDYAVVRHENIHSESLGRFFKGAFTTHEFPNSQHFDFDSLKGRLLSSSYAPGPGHPDHEPMLAELRRVYETHQTAGIVSFYYITRVHIGA
jgi:SAM-dependent methyltransferase